MPSIREGELPRLLILDGVSGGGKTTFLKRFLEDYPYTAVPHGRNTGYLTTHFGRCPVEVEEDEEYLDAQRRVSEWYMEVVEFVQGGRLILDRWVLSNIIYGHVYGNQITVASGMAADMIRRLNFWYGESWRHLIFVAKPHVLKERNIGRNREDFMEILGLKATLSAFRGLAGNRLYKATVVDTSESLPHETYEYVMEKIRVPSN